MKYILITLLLSIGAHAQPVEAGTYIANPLPNQPPPVIEVHFPDFISPNGDGINDIFILNAEPGNRVEIKVYSRWGNLVYSNGDYKDDFSPRKLSDGVYAFWVRVHEGDYYKDFSKMVTIIK